jgi:uncharacterized protein (TIGR04206 family)
VNDRLRTRGDERDDRRSDATRRTLALLALAALPWVVLTDTSGGVTLVFPWGLMTPFPTHVTTLWEFLFRRTMGLPNYILAWPVGVACWACAVASAAFG